MSNKVKDFLLVTIAVIVMSLIAVACTHYATSSKAWYAGSHTEGCNGTNDCGCYEKLIKADKERAEK